MGTVSKTVRRLAAALLALMTVAAATPAFGQVTARARPATAATAGDDAGATAGDALRWLLAVSARPPVGEAEQAAHLAPVFRTAVGGADGFNGVLTSVGALVLRRVTDETPQQVTAIVGSKIGDLDTIVVVDDTGLITGLRFTPYVPDLGSWAQVDAALAATAPQASFLSAIVGPDGRCQPVHSVAAAVRRPLGSAFKLYVLGALGAAVASGRARWDDQLAIRDDWKSLPSGRLQDEPAGTELTLRQYADLMISISDNTAADHLIHRLGRGAVEAQLSRFGNARPAASEPFLTTRQLFVLKGVGYPAGAEAYLALPRPLRAAALRGVDRVPLTRVGVWQQPRKVDQLEWFGSPADLCRAFAGLARQNADPALAPIGAALSINDGGIGLDRGRFPTVWFKGGSEPGVLTLNYLARAAGGQTIVSSVMLANPRQAFADPATTIRALTIAKAGVQLAVPQK